MRSVLFFAIYCVGRAASVPTTLAAQDSSSSRVLSKQEEAASGAAALPTSSLADFANHGLKSGSDFTIDDVKLAAIMATNAYYPPKLGGFFTGGGFGVVQAGPDERVINKDANFDRSIPWCWSTMSAGWRGADDENPYLVESVENNMNRTMNCYDHEPLLAKWEYQGRVREPTKGVWGVNVAQSGLADADIYYNNESVTDAAGVTYDADEICYVAIAGTDDNEDKWNDLRAATARNIWKKNPGETRKRTYKVGKGFKVYYDAMRDEIQTACEGPARNCADDDSCDDVKDRTVWVTGHSLGAAAANIMHAYGDATRSITFGTPKTFTRARMKKGAVASGKCDASRDENPNLLENPSMDMFSVDRDGSCGAGRTGLKDWGSTNICVDGVATVSPGSVHCPKEYYKIYKETTGTSDADASTSYGFEDMSDQLDKPNFVANGAGVQNTLTVHPMPAGYLKYLYGGCFAGYDEATGKCPIYVPPSGAWPEMAIDADNPLLCRTVGAGCDGSTENGGSTDEDAGSDTPP